jgi:carnitine-CoA ligase
MKAQLRERTLLNVLRTNRHAAPKKVVLRDSVTEVTNEELWQRARRFAGGLAERGVGPGSHVLLMLDNHIDNVVAFIGLSFVGAVSVPTNTAFKGNILGHVIRDAGTSVAIVERRFVRHVREAADGALEVIIERGPGDNTEGAVDFQAVAAGSPVDPVDANAWDVLTIGYTSGTTGLSKGAFVTHAHAYNVSYLPEIQGPHGPDDVSMIVCPMFHATGTFGGWFGAFIVGAGAYIASSFSPSTFWKEANAAEATSVVLVGTMAEFLMRQPPQPGDRDTTIRRVYMVPLTPRAAEMMERFDVTIRTSFGSTESGCFISHDRDEDVLSGSLGRVRPGYEARVVDDHDMEVQTGDVGEAVVRSADPWLISFGYIGNDRATAEAWRNGWFHTGDAVRKDEHGMFYFVDRKKDAIRRRGENISSIEVEREVMAHPDVVECAAFGVASDDLEEEVKVAVVRSARSTTTEADLIEFLMDRMPYYSVPRYVSFVEDLPKTPTAKVRKTVLRDAGIDGAWDRVSAGIVVRR